MRDLIGEPPWSWEFEYSARYERLIHPAGDPMQYFRALLSSPQQRPDLYLLEIGGALMAHDGRIQHPTF